MLQPADRAYLHKLRKEECTTLLNKLGLSTEGAVATMRVRLVKVARSATPEQIVIFQDGKKEFVNARENAFIKTMIFNLPEDECKEMLDDFDLEEGENDEANRTALQNHLNNVDEGEKEAWVDYAKDFCAELEKKQEKTTVPAPARENQAQGSGHDNSDTGTNYEDAQDDANRGFFDPSPFQPPPTVTSTGYHRPTSRPRLNETASLMEQVRKWGITFNGKDGPQAALEFLSRVKNRAESYGVPEHRLHLVLVALLTDDAEGWYNCTKDEWSDWEGCEKSFKLYFLPARMREEMSDEVRSYKQQKGQSIKEFILQLKMRMSWVPEMTAAKQLERVYKNLDVQYQLYIKRSEFVSLQDLIRLGEDFEEKRRRQEKPTSSDGNQYSKNQNSRHNNAERSNVQKNYALETETTESHSSNNDQATGSSSDSKKVNPFRDNARIHPETSRREPTKSDDKKPKYTCYNCDQPGHTSRYCRAPYRPTCRHCKKKGISTEKCGCQKETRPPHICAKCRVAGHTEQECPIRTDSTPEQTSSAAMTYRCGALGMSHDRRPRKQITIAEGTFTAVLDTGATTCYVNGRVRNHLKSKAIEPTSIKVVTRLANGLDTSTDEVYHLHISLGEKKICQNLLVLNGMKEEAILGIDALEKFGFQLVENGMKTPSTCVLDMKEREIAELANWSSWETRGDEIIKVISREESLQNIFPIVECCSSVKATSELSTVQNQQLQEMLNAEFKKFENIKECTHLVEHKIKMKTDEPIRLKYSPKNPTMRRVISDQVDDLLQKNLIEPSASAYCSPVVLVKKKDGSWRMCIDYRKINDQSERDAYPIPHIPNTLNRLKRAKFVTALDLKNGYWQIPIHAASRQYTAFIVPGRGLFQWRVMPFGLHSAPATFQRFLDLLITQNFEDYAVAYLDDIIVFSESFEDHVIHLQSVLSKLAEANLQINKEKSTFCQKSLKYLGHIVGEGGIRTDPEKVKAIEELPPPQDVSGVRRIVGMAGWYGAFIPNFTEVIAPLNELLSKKATFTWGERQQEAFQKLKDKLKTSPILSCPDYNKSFFLQTDASNVGLGAVLFQREGDQEKVIAFRSRKLQAHEKNYTTTEKECLAVLWAIQRNLEYLEGIPFTVITDHLALKWIFNLPNPTGRLGRWVVELRNHDFKLEYRKGKDNVVPDALSRHPIPWETNEESLCASTSTGVPKCKWLDRQMTKVAKNPEKFPEYSIVLGQLMKNCGVGELDESNWKLCVAKPLREQVLIENHSLVTAGHLGIRKTLIRLRKKYYWPGMVSDVKKFVNSCEPCLEIKIPQQKPAGLMHTTKASGPWDIVTMDYIGPFPRSTAGHQHVLVIQDKFSKWVEIIPQRKATSTGLRKATKERILCHFGWPRVVITDNGSQFVSHLFKNFLKDNGIMHQLTPPYSPQCNPTERVNRVIKTMVQTFLTTDHRKWDEHLAEIQFAINSAVQESTGFSPAELNFGRDLRTGNTVFEKELPGVGEKEVTANEHMEKIKELCTIAKRQLQIASQQQAKYYNLRRRTWTPSVGETVYKKNHYLSNAANAFAAKLSKPFSGPYTVVNYISPTVVELRGATKPKKLIRVHLKDLKEMHVQKKST